MASVDRVDQEALLNNEAAEGADLIRCDPPMLE